MGDLSHKLKAGGGAAAAATTEEHNTACAFNHCQVRSEDLTGLQMCEFDLQIIAVNKLVHAVGFMGVGRCGFSTLDLCRTLSIICKSFKL